MDTLIYSGGYLLSFVTYITLFLLFSFVPNKNVVTRGLVVFCLCFSVWGLGNALIVYSSSDVISAYYFVFESIRYSGLMVLLLALLTKHETLKSVFKSPQFVSIAVLLFFAVILSSYSEESKQLGFTLILAVVIFLLILIETIFSKAKNKLWALRPMILCFFTMLIIDFSLYAEGALFVQFEPNLLIAKSYLNFVLAPLLLWSIRRTTELQVKVYVSREVVFQSTVVLGAGVYLGLLATVGYYIQQFGEVWTPILQIVFLTLGFVLLIAIMLSHSVKTNLKIFIQKNFFANKFDYRAQWLTLTEELGKEGSVYQNVMSTLLLSLNAKQGVLVKFDGVKIKLLADTKQKSTELMLREISEFSNKITVDNPAFELTKVEDLRELKRLEFDVAIPISDEHTVWGVAFLCQDKEHYINIDWEVSEYLHVVSIQVAHYLFQYEANEQLMENAQFSAFSRMSAFVVHDLKNVLAQVQMIVSNSAKHRDNPEFIDDTFETLTHTQTRLAKVIKQLKEKKVGGTENQLINIGQVIESDVAARFKDTNRLQLSLNHSSFIRADEDRFINVLCHIVDNALQASDAKDKVTISMQERPDETIITISDNGNGMSPEFIKDKLFKPFETTKGNAGMGIGAYDAKVFTEELNGEVEVFSTEGEGTDFVLTIPLSHQ